MWLFCHEMRKKGKEKERGLERRSEKRKVVEVDLPPCLDSRTRARSEVPMSVPLRPMAPPPVRSDRQDLKDRDIPLWDTLR
ncbi:unnamed protein product [Cochlearia groenlandica]